MEQSVVTNILMATMPTNGNKSEDLPQRPNFKAEDFKMRKDVDINSEKYPPMQIVWRNVSVSVFLHSTALFGLFKLVSGQIMWQTVIFAHLVIIYSLFGVTGGSHRLWSHKCYKAKLPLRIILMIGQTIAQQNSIWEWSRDHRVHHKYSETIADPHNAKRGFFFSHMGWLLVRKHPAVILKGKQIDISDLEADPVVAFQKKHYSWMGPLFCFVLPTGIPWYFWGEDFMNSYIFAGVFRYVLSLHFTWTVNSIAHMWGNKPYDKNIGPVESGLVSWLAIGEGWHNYHHTFPWDYKAAEFGGFKTNLSTFFINQLAKIGWAYDLKTVPKEIIKQRIKRTGDGSHPQCPGRPELQDHSEGGPYAWGDVDIPPEDISVTQTLFSKKDL